MNIIHAIIFGLVEGLTEFLPISSTAHLDLTRALLTLPADDFLKTFEVVIQLGAIAAVALMYWRRLWRNLPLAASKLGTAFVPTAIVGFAAYPLVKNYFLGNTALMIAMLIIGGVGLIVFEHWHKEKPAPPSNSLSTITHRQALIIGLAQSLAIVPGVSRAGATIIGGLSLGISRSAIVEFSFLLAIPTMLAASGWDLLNTGFNFNLQQYGLLAVGLITAFFSALIVVRWLIKFIQHHSFVFFGWYRIIIGILLWLYFYYL